MKKKIVFTFFVMSFVAIIGIFNIKNIKDAFITSPLADWYIALFRQETPFDDNHVITTLIDGSKIIVNTNDRCVCWFIRLLGRWDSNELAAVQHLIKPGDNVVEVGANFGVYTLLMSNIVGNSGHIMTFEPNPNVNKYLEKSIQLNGMKNIDLQKSAAGGTERESSIVYGEKNIGGGYLGEAVPDENMNFKVVRLDEVVKVQPVNVLKIDAEGCEEEVIHGAHDIIQSNKDITLIIEWSKKQLQRQGGDPVRFSETLKKYGFNVWSIGKKEGENPTFVPLTYKELLSIEYCDLVLSRKSVL